MSQSLHFFEEQKKELSCQLNLLDKIAEKMDLNHISKQINNSILTLYREQFEIMVVGEFSHGKSTFINALIQKDLLPTSVKPTTALLNKINYSESANIVLHYKNKSQRGVSEELFKRIIVPSDSEDKENRGIIDLIESIDHAELSYPFAICKNNIVIIDSPGTNDLDPAREALTHHYIPKSDAAIFTLDANKALADSELDFIKNRILLADIQKIFFIINFKDLLRTREDEDKVYQRVESILSEIITDPKIFLVSSRHALLNYKLQNGEAIPRLRNPLLSLEETGFPEFEKNLIDFLQYDRGAVKLQKPIQTGLQIANELKNKHIPFERMSLNNKINNLNQISEKLLNDIKKANDLGKSSAENIRLTLLHDGSNIKSWYEKELHSIAQVANYTLDQKYYSDCDSNNVKRAIENATAPLENKLNERLKTKVDTLINKTVNSESSKIETALTSIENQFFIIVSDIPTTSSIVSPNDFFKTFNIPSSLIAATLAGGFFLSPIFLVVGGLAATWHWASNLFNGVDSKLNRLQNEMNKRFVESIPSKVRNFDKQWAIISSDAKTSYEEIVSNDLEKKQKQLAILIKNNQMSEQESSDILQQLDEFEQKVMQVQSSIINIQKTMKVGVSL